MKITIKLNPQQVSGFDFNGRARSQVAVLAIIRSGHVSSWSNSGHHALSPYRNEDTVRVYSIEKHRKKVEVLAKPKKWTKKELRANGFNDTDVKFTTRVVTKPAHWTGVYYDIPTSVLKMAGLRVVQTTRTFYFEKV